jgi:hypothetical protein
MKKTVKERDPLCTAVIANTCIQPSSYMLSSGMRLTVRTVRQIKRIHSEGEVQVSAVYNHYVITPFV